MREPTQRRRAVRSRGAVVIALTAVLVSWAAGPASAQRVTAEDASGDARAAADILSVRYTNGSARLGALIHLRDLKHHGSAGVTLQKRRWSGTALLLRIVKRKHKRVHAGLYHERPDGAFYRLACKVAGRWQAGRDRIRVSAPQRCMKRNRGNWRMWTYARGAGDLDYTHTSRVPYK